MTDGSNDKKTGLRKGLATYGDAEFSLFMRRVFIKAMGYTDDALDRPIIGITDTYSDFNPCHGNVPDLIEAVKRGVMLAGGMPMKFPTVSIHESFSHRPRRRLSSTLQSILLAQNSSAMRVARALGPPPNSPIRTHPSAMWSISPGPIRLMHVNAMPPRTCSMCSPVIVK